MARKDAKLDPTALTVADAARLLGNAIGQAIDAAKIEADIAQGAPVNGDGTINLMQYCAWLVRELNRGSD